MTADDIFDQSDELKHIREFARSRRANPHATLGAVLRRAVAAIEPQVMLPPIVGGHVSCNLYTATGGASGTGKGAADAAGNAAIMFIDPQTGEVPEPACPSIGSGEGLARMFKGGRDESAVTRVHVTVPEISTLAALAGRQGTTLVGELLKGYMGEPLGFRNASKETSTSVAAHSYRLCLGVGVQPQNAKFFLDREKDGFPQRFLWLPTGDPGAPRDRPPAVEPREVVLPTFSADEPFWGDRHTITVADQICAEIDLRAYWVLTSPAGGGGIVDPLDGHVMLTRLKVAFALALLHGLSRITVDEWNWAHILIDVSRKVRAEMATAVAEKGRADNEARGLSRALQDEAIDKRKQERVNGAILRKIAREAQPVSKRELQQVLAGPLREYLDVALDLLVQVEAISKVENRYSAGPAWGTYVR